MKTQVKNKEGNVVEITAILQELLADETALSALTRDAHWNITGPNFMQLHGLFEKQYNELDEQLDTIAERVRALGQPVKGTLQDLASLTVIKGSGKTTGKEKQLLETLLRAHEYVIGSLQKSIRKMTDLGDDGSADLLTGLVQVHQKMAWMLRSSLE